MIGRSGKTGSGISVLAARHDDDDDQTIVLCTKLSFLVWYKPMLYVDLRPGPEIALASLADNMGQG